MMFMYLSPSWLGSQAGRLARWPASQLVSQLALASQPCWAELGQVRLSQAKLGRAELGRARPGQASRLVRAGLSWIELGQAGPS